MIKKINFFGLFLFLSVISFPNDFYLVKKGDTLYSISKKYNISVLDIKKINNLSSNMIKAGDKIFTSVKSNKHIIHEKPFYYTVKKGDTLYKISNQYNIPIKLLISNNNITNNQIYIGDKIYLTNKNNSKIKSYTVKKGDSLIKIAKSYNTTVSKIKKINNLSSNTLHVGDKIQFKSTKKNIKEDPYYYKWPIKYAGITSPFGYRIHPIKKIKILHTGVDLRANIGTNLYSPANGKVITAGWMGGYGKIIIIKHDHGYETRHAHLSKIFVKRGDILKKGQLIGETGKTGNVTGPHLHYEIRKDNKPINPIEYKK